MEFSNYIGDIETSTDNEHEAFKELKKHTNDSNSRRMMRIDSFASDKIFDHMFDAKTSEG